MTKQEIRFLVIAGIAYFTGGLVGAFPQAKIGIPVFIIGALIIGILVARWDHEI